MTPERWQQISQLYRSTQERDAAERDAFLRDACRGDEELRHAVESLLAQDGSAERFLAGLVREAAADVLTARPSASLVGRRIGVYQVEARIGAGGMGQVYRARDTTLHRDVALKVLPQEISLDAVRVARFEHEARVLASLNHPNIAIIHELREADGIHVIVMEYVEGDTVKARVTSGPLHHAEIVKLATQIAAALEAAHRIGIIHRDVKSSNIMITPQGRAKVLDFGLAKRTTFDERPSQYPTIEATQSAVVIGTVPYMSPEQALGKTLDPRSDLFSLGVVLYEMATGRLPFRGSTAYETIDNVVHHDPEPVTSINPTVPPGLERVISKALDKEPAHRYQTASELQVDLGRLDDLGPAVAPRPTFLTRKRRLALAGSILVLAFLVVLAGMNGLGWRQRLSGTASGNGRAGLASPPPTARRSLAVLGFKNLSGQPSAAWLSTALAEMLTTELAAGEKLRTIPGEDVARMKAELSLMDAEALAKPTLARVRKNLGADFIVLGGYVDLGREAGGQIRLDLRLQDAMAGDTIAAVAETGTEGNLFDLVTRTGARLREKLGLGAVPAHEVNAVRAALPSNTEAARLYAEGLAKLRSFDDPSARDLLEKAVTADPNHALAHSALAAAWSALGYDALAQGEAKKAFDLSSTLSREERLSVEGRYRETTHEWDRAIETYRTLWDLLPDTQDYGLRLASAQISSGKAKDALATVDRLRNRPPPERDDPRVAVAEAQAANVLGDFKRAREAAATAAENAESREAKLVVAAARNAEGRAFWRSGEPQKARAAYEEALRIWIAAGERVAAARVLSNQAALLTEQGDLGGARRMFEQALAVAREVGNKDLVSNTLNNIGYVLMEQGDFENAKTRYAEALAIKQEIGDKSNAARFLYNLGWVLKSEGDFAAAKKRYQESVVIGRELGNGSLTILGLFGLANLLAPWNQGDMSAAHKAYERVVAMARESGDKQNTASVLDEFTDLLYEEGDFAGARKYADEALSIYNELDEKGRVAVSRISLASLAIAQGDAAAAEPLAVKAVEEFHAEHAADGEARARVVLARCFLAQGQTRKAQEALAPAKELAKSRAVRFAAEIVTARVLASQGEPAQAETSLERILREASRGGFVGFQLEARLALGEIELQSGHAAAGRARLEALERDATAKGFGRIARLAAAIGKAAPSDHAAA